MAVLALTGSTGALPHDHHRYWHEGHSVLDPLLERRPGEVVGAKRTDFGSAPCSRLAETGCAQIKDKPKDVACHEYYEMYPDTGKAVICRKATFSSGCRNYVFGEGMFNTDHVHRPPPSGARSPRPAGVPPALSSRARNLMAGDQELRRPSGYAAEGCAGGGGVGTDASRRRRRAGERRHR